MYVDVRQMLLYLFVSAIPALLMLAQCCSKTKDDASSQMPEKPEKPNLPGGKKKILEVAKEVPNVNKPTDEKTKSNAVENVVTDQHPPLTKSREPKSVKTHEEKPKQPKTGVAVSAEESKPIKKLTKPSERMAVHVDKATKVDTKSDPVKQIKKPNEGKVMHDDRVAAKSKANVSAEESEPTTIEEKEIVTRTALSIELSANFEAMPDAKQPLETDEALSEIDVAVDAELVPLVQSVTEETNKVPDVIDKDDNPNNGGAESKEPNQGLDSAEQKKVSNDEAEVPVRAAEIDGSVEPCEIVEATIPNGDNDVGKVSVDPEERLDAARLRIPSTYTPEFSLIPK